MKFSKLTMAVAVALTASASSSAFAINLYVDTKTKQIYAEPGKHRVLMGEFEKVGDKPQQAETAPVTPAVSQELAAIHQDLELKQNEIKALEERAIETREGKAKNDEKWFNKISLRGYTQMRYNVGLSGDRTDSSNLAVTNPNRHPELRSVGDGGIKNNSGFTFRRVRLVFSGDINDYVSMYIQPDFATTNGDLNFAQLRDAYFDLHADKAHEYRVRAGQSKVPFGWENLQSSQNRLTLDRADALNSAVPSERDLGLFAYWTPSDTQKLWKSLTKKGLKTSGDYGVLGVGVYNGSSLNKAETNDNMYVVAHSTYPMDLGFLGSFLNGQVLEVGADAMGGQFTPTTAAYTPYDARLDARGRPIAGASVAPTIRGDGNNNVSEGRVGVHAVLFPQPFGLQTEWNWGYSGALDTQTNIINKKGLNGGYVQAMYKIDNVFNTEGTVIPYVKWQTYKGAWKAATNSPFVNMQEIEAGVEYQVMKALELTLAYSHMDRTNVANMGQARGDVMRMQLQVNY